MPIPGARYRVMTTKSGKKIRLAFKGRTVVEAKNLKSGATHTAAEFAADRLRRRRPRTLTDHITSRFAQRGKAN